MKSENRNIKQRKKRIWQSFVTVLASIVVFVTTYALIIPAITWERTLICEITEHTHSESCYSDGTLVCSKTEHTHTAACFDAPKAAAKLYICGKTEHTHTEDCYFADGTLKCTLEEHKHSSFCMALTASKATTATQKSTVILACSDVQDPANSWLFLNGSSLGDYTNQNKILNNIITQVKNVYPTIDGFFCGGDYNFDVTREGRQYQENGAEKTYTADLALNTTKRDVQTFSGTIKKLIPTLDDDKITLIQGNHDVLCEGLTETGGYDKGTYAVYVINEQDYPSGSTVSQSLCQKTADGLRMWLQSLVSVKYNKPVFILSHVPLHYSTRVITDGDAVYAQLLYDAIESNGSNLNIFFLYGHDHAHGDDDYLGGAAQFLTRGDKITIAQSGNRTGSLEKTLNFTYMNYGFVGYFWDTWGQQSGTINRNTDYTLTMTTFEINGSDVIIRRWDENGQHILKAAGAASQGDRGIADPLAPNTKTYASPQLVRTNNSTQNLRYIDEIDKDTKVKVSAFGSTYSIEEKTNLDALKKAGITDYLAYDIKVQDFAGSAQITMPSKPGYNKVWYVNGDHLEEVEDAIFNGNTVTFTATHFSIYANGAEVPDEGDWYLVKTPASELRPGDKVLLLNNTEDHILFSRDDYAWPDSYTIKELYEDGYSGTIEPIAYDGKLYYPYDTHMQTLLDEWDYLLTVTEGQGLMNCNGKILDLNFSADDWGKTFFTSGGAVINADGTITQTIGGTKHYLTFNPATDADLSFRSSTANSQYAQLVFFRLEQFETPALDDTNWFHVEYYEGWPYNVCNLIDFPSGKTGYAISHIDIFAEFKVPVAVNGRVFDFDPKLLSTDTQYVTLSGQYGDGTPAGYNLESRGVSYDTERGDQIRLGDSDDVTSLRNYLEIGTEDDPVYWTVTFEKTFTVYVDDNRLATEWFNGAEAREIPFCFSATTTYWDTEHNKCPGFEDPIPCDYSGIDLDLGSGFGTITVQKNVSGIELGEDKTFVFHVYHFDESGRLFDDCDVTVKGGMTTGQNTLVYVPYGTYYVEEDMDSAAISGYSVESTYDRESVEVSEANPSGLLIATNTYTPEEPDIPEGIWKGDIDFNKSEKQTSATDDDSTAAKENVHTICLDVVPPEKKNVAILMLMDTTSSMRVQCANCGVPIDQHQYYGQACEVTHWDGTTTTVYACDHFVERKGISEAAAQAFISSLGNLPNQYGKVYVRLVPFAGEAHPEYNNGIWIDVTANDGVASAQTALANLPQYSGTNVSAAMRSAYEILSNDLPSGVKSADTYVLLLTDGAQSVTDLANLPPEATSTPYVNKWLKIWSGYNHYEYIPDAQRHVDTENPLHTVNDGYYIGAPYYAEKITDDDGLNSHLYTVMLGNNLDWGSKFDFENWRYIAGIGITAHEHLKSFSDYSLYATTDSELTAYYNSILYALAPTLETITVTDPMSDHVDFLGFTDSNGNPINNSVAAYDAQTRTITWNPKAATPDADGHYRLYYNVRIKTEAAGFVDGQLYPANKTTTATYTLEFPDGHTESGKKDAKIPEIHGRLGTLSFTKVSEDGGGLQGAKFKLVHDPNCPYCHGAHVDDITFSSGANGVVNVTNIPSGHKYILSETQAPSGHKVFSGTLDVTVSYRKVTINGSNSAWNDSSKQLTDPVNTVALPATGSIGTVILYVVGALLMLGALMIGRIVWRRREGRGEV